MLALPSSCRYFLYRHQADMRKGFDGLSGLVQQGLLKDPLSGDVFIPELPLESNTEVYLNCFSLS